MSHLSPCYLLLEQPELQQLIVDCGALPHLIDLLKRHEDGSTTRAVNSLIRRAADAITNLAHENSSIKIRVRCAPVKFRIKQCLSSIFLNSIGTEVQDGRWDSTSSRIARF